MAGSRQIERVIGTIGKFAGWVTSREMEEAQARPEACDFLVGNPHDVAPAAYVDALTRGAQPTGSDHFAYKTTTASWWTSAGCRHDGTAS